ncbi:MAG TPA: patatin-like phospholipase family protein [Thermoanaerobaculia bacterium]|nr:patatin-like phospholipase family protein [Thermoanaerobaculia bacterium]
MKSGPEALDLLRSANRVGYLLPGGSARCVFQVGVIEELAALGVRPSMLVGVSGGAWNAAAVAAGKGHRLRHYWRCFTRLPRVALANLVREGSPFLFAELHRRTFATYVGAAALRAPSALPLWVGVTRLRDGEPLLVSPREVDEPLQLLLASNYLPPFYTLPPRILGQRCGDGALSDNLPYEKLFAAGCDAVVIAAARGESDGELARSLVDRQHVIDPRYAERTVVIRPRHRLPISFTETDWGALVGAIEIGRLRTREVLLGERHGATDARGEVHRAGYLLARLVDLYARSRRARRGGPRRAPLRRP